jgi:hypothetical protein
LDLSLICELSVWRSKDLKIRSDVRTISQLQLWDRLCAGFERWWFNGWVERTKVNWQGQECEVADMGRGQQMSMDFCVEVQSKGKAHTRMECEIRSMRRVVCAALFAALLTFTSYVVYINSGIPSEEDITFFEGQLTPLEAPLTVCLLLLFPPSFI